MSPRWIVYTCALATLTASGCCYFPKAFSPERVWYPGTCGEACLDPADACDVCSVCGTADCVATHPFRFLKSKATCGAGCGGEIYWGEWISDPPDDCDPCDDHGNFVGPSGCCVRWVDRFWSGIAGHRHGCSCDHCGGPGLGEEVVYEGEVWSDEEFIDGAEATEWTPEWEDLPAPAAPPSPPKAARRRSSIRAPYARTSTAHYIP